MGCSQGKATKPTAAGASKPSPEPTSTLLSPSSKQKQHIKATDQVASVDEPEESNVVVDASVTEAVVRPDGELSQAPEAVDAHASSQENSKDWPLRWKALRIYAMASQGSSGSLNAKEVAGDSKNSLRFIEMLQRVFEGDETRSLSRVEWLQKVKQLVLQDQAQASEFLDLCVVHLHERAENWPLREEALQVFRMGDRNGNGQLEMHELAEIRQSEEYAQAMMDNIDIDKNGIVSKGEWLAYIKRLADQNEASTAAVLALYRNHLNNSSNTAEAYDSAKHAIDVLVQDSGVTGTSSWWCC